MLSFSKSHTVHINQATDIQSNIFCIFKCDCIYHTFAIYNTTADYAFLGKPQLFIKPTAFSVWLHLNSSYALYTLLLSFPLKNYNFNGIIWRKLLHSLWLKSSKCSGSCITCWAWLLVAPSPLPTWSAAGSSGTAIPPCFKHLLVVDIPATSKITQKRLSLPFPLSPSSFPLAPLHPSSAVCLSASGSNLQWEDGAPSSVSALP